MVGAWPAARLARSYSRRTAILLGGVVTALGVVVVLATDQLSLQILAAALLGAGGIVVHSSGVALLADATASGERPRRFGQQIAIGTIAAFLAAYVAGQLAAPVARTVGDAAGSLLVVRVLVGLGGIVAALSALPILFVRSVPVLRGSLAAPLRRALLLRFGALEALFGFGAGSFLPFTNLFFADRFGLDFSAIGLALGTIAVGGSLGALVHGIHLAPRLGQLRAIVLVELLSIPFALAAGVVALPAIAAAALSIRAALMYGASSTYRAFTLSSFSPSERAGATALLTIAWSAAAGLGSVSSGAVRSAFGDAGWTLNLATLGIAYLATVALTIAFFGRHEPRGDEAVGVEMEPAPHSAP